MKKTMVRSNRLMTLVMMMTIAISAAAMPYNTARNEALFLADKMAYELGLTATQYEAVYEINLDYLLNVDTRADVFGFWWEVRNRDLRYVLSTWQYDRFMASEWFYRPVVWGTGGWTFSIYTRYGVGRRVAIAIEVAASMPDTTSTSPTLPRVMATTITEITTTITTTTETGTTVETIMGTPTATTTMETGTTVATTMGTIMATPTTILQ